MKGVNYKKKSVNYEKKGVNYEKKDVNSKKKGTVEASKAHPKALSNINSSSISVGRHETKSGPEEIPVL